MADTSTEVLADRVDRLTDEVKSIRLEQGTNTRNSVELHVKNEQLEKRLVQHSARHETHYTELWSAVSRIQKELSEFQKELLTRIDDVAVEMKKDMNGIKSRQDRNGGRDSVLKFLFGGAIVAIITGLIKIFTGI